MDSKPASVKLKDDQKIVLTAFVTNWWKARSNKMDYWKEHKLAIGETLREAPLYKDNLWMQRLASPETAKLLTTEIDLCQRSEMAMNSVHPIVGPFHAARHRYHSKSLKMCLNSDKKLEQVIVLGAGLDTRSVAKKDYPVRFFEVDLQPIIDLKAHLYAAYKESPNATLISIDYLRENLIEKVVDAGVNLSQNTHFIWEGNVMYLPTETVKALLIELQQKFSGQVTISFDFYPKEFIEMRTGDPDATHLVEQFAAMGAQFKGGIDDIHAFSKEINSEVLNHFDGAELLKEYQLDTTPDPRLAYFHLATLCIRPCLEPRAQYALNK